MAKRYQRDVKKALIEQRQTDNTMAKRYQRDVKKALIEQRQTDNTMAKRKEQKDKHSSTNHYTANYRLNNTIL
jgi:hypothetical protein